VSLSACLPYFFGRARIHLASPYSIVTTAIDFLSSHSYAMLEPLSGHSHVLSM
jgi:hypothetical protein